MVRKDSKVGVKKKRISRAPPKASAPPKKQASKCAGRYLRAKKAAAAAKKAAAAAKKAAAAAKKAGTKKRRARNGALLREHPPVPEHLILPPGVRPQRIAHCPPVDENGMLLPLEWAIDDDEGAFLGVEEGGDTDPEW